MPHRTVCRKHHTAMCVVHAKACAQPASTLTAAGLGGAQHFCRQLGLGWEPAGVYYFAMIMDLRCAEAAAGAAPADPVRRARTSFSANLFQVFQTFQPPQATYQSGTFGQASLCARLPKAPGQCTCAPHPRLAAELLVLRRRSLAQRAVERYAVLFRLSAIWHPASPGILRARQFMWERHLLRNRVAHGSLMPWVSWLHEAAGEPEEALPDSLLSPDLEVGAWPLRLGQGLGVTLPLPEPKPFAHAWPRPALFPVYAPSRV